MRLGLVGIDSSHADDFLRHFNLEGRLHDMRVTALWAPHMPDERVAELARLAPDAEAMPTLDALLDAVDAVIVGDRDGGLHRGHAVAALAASKPVFVDKPLANSLADAQAIVAEAERSGVPLLSGSALRWQPETALLKARIAYLEPPLSVSAYGTWYPQSEYGGPIFYAIHTIELMQELIGVGCADLEVEAGIEPVVRYRAGDVKAKLTFHPLGESGHSAFGATVKAGKVRIDQPIPLPDDYMLPVCKRIAQMLRSGKGMGRDELLAPLRVMEQFAALLPVPA
jgi:predicted dehydrogenase